LVEVTKEWIFLFSRGGRKYFFWDSINEIVWKVLPALILIAENLKSTKTTLATTKITRLLCHD
jgi:hypothetical protein